MVVSFDAISERNLDCRHIDLVSLGQATLTSASCCVGCVYVLGHGLLTTWTTTTLYPCNIIISVREVGSEND